MRRMNTEETGRRKSPTVKNEKEDQKCREYGGGYQGSLEKRAENINAGMHRGEAGKEKHPLDSDGWTW